MRVELVATLPCRSCGKLLNMPDDGRWIVCDRCGVSSQLPGLTFGEFVSLLKDADRAELNDRVLLPVGLRLESDGSLVSIGLTREYDRPIAPGEAHRIVQFDPGARYAMVQIAGFLWR